MNPATRKNIAAAAGVAAACAACCAVPLVAAASAVAAPVGIGAVLLAAIAGGWAWLRRRAKRPAP